MEKSFSCKIRNQINEISHIESLLYKKYFRCLLVENKNDKNKNLSKNNLLIKEGFNENFKEEKYFLCKKELTSVLNYNSNRLKNSSLEHAVCLSNCTDLLNFPSEELACYEKCEEEYYIMLKSLKLDLLKNFE